MADITVEKYHFPDDGITPNNRLPVIVYRQVTDAEDTSAWLEERFKANGWTNNWRDIVLPYDHFHSTTHEVLGVGKGSVELQIGGQKGIIVNVSKGDALILPAGVGHASVSDHKNYEMVGGYPDGKDWDLLTGTAEERKHALPRIKNLPLPTKDPIFGEESEMLRLWK
ncbi:cupin [Emticicia agri]|uniref:Cupin n=1 Tax=Emticicia agri TaxID=2492393 RepID=A0A4Q5LVX7_9BACT|nr:cupin [Emticicia agri]RYU93633.1 cupin [Emticicia agri]